VVASPALYAEPLVYNADPKQRLFHRAVRQYNYVYLKGGRNSGKTTAGAIQSIMEAVEYQPGSRGIVVAATYDTVRDAAMKEFFRWLPRQFIKSWNVQHKELILVNGSEIVFRSADNPDNLRGPNRNWAWFEEPRNLKNQEAFNIVTAGLRPTVKAWLTSTPDGIFGWMYKIFHVDPLPSSTVIRVRSSENSHGGIDYVARMKSQYSAKEAQQELEAEDISFEGLVYDNFSVDRNVTTDAEYDPNLGGIELAIDDGYTLGTGPGTASYHPRVILYCQETALGGLNIFNERYTTGESSYDQTITEMLEYPNLEHPYPFPDIAYVDSSAAMLRGALTVKGISNTGATHSVAQGIRNVRRMISDANNVVLLKIHPRCKELIREFQSYRYDDRAQIDGDRKPLAIDDHGPSSVRYIAFHLRFE